MVDTIYIARNQTAVFKCSQCDRTKTVDLAAFGGAKPPQRFKLKCPCGQVATVVLEKRRQFRKATQFPGTYVLYVNGQPKSKGVMTVKDISGSGMKLRITSGEPVSTGDVLRVSFYLDDAQRSLIQKKVIVRNVNPPFVGTEFSPTEVIDKALGFYLRS